MRIIHLNLGALRPLGGRRVNGDRPSFLPARMVCHCLLIESDRGLVLVDTGFGLEDVRRLERLWSGFRRADSLRRHLRRVIVQTEGRWLPHAADTYFDHREVDPTSPRSTPGLAAFQKRLEFDGEARRTSRERVRALGAEVEVFCSHDPVELDRYVTALTRP